MAIPSRAYGWLMNREISRMSLSELFPRWSESDRRVVTDILDDTRCDAMEFNEANHYVICRSQGRPVAYLNKGFVELFRPNDELATTMGLVALPRQVQTNPVCFALSVYDAKTEGQTVLRGKPCPTCTYERPLAGGCTDERDDCPFCRTDGQRRPTLK